MRSERLVERRTVLTGSVAAVAALAAGCSSRSSTPTAAPTARVSTPTASTAPSAAAPSTAAGPTATPAPASAAVMAGRATLPILCYHQLRDFASSDQAYARQLLICPPSRFREQLDAIAAAGYTTVSPDQYVAHLETGAALPHKPVLLSFDDSQGSQMTEALPQLKARSMTATFFAMTVVLGNSGWMTKDDLKRLDAAGMTVAAHTWDHHRVDQYSGNDWKVQLDQPRAVIEKIIGKEVRHFAYPYGAFKPFDYPHVMSAGYRTAFQLADQKVDPARPLFSLRRTLVDSGLSGAALVRQLDAGRV